MQKIYLTLALAVSVIACVNGQNRQMNLTEDQLAGTRIVSPAIDLSGIQIHKGLNPVVGSVSCDTLATTTAGGNGHNGNMFDITNASSVTVQIVGLKQCFSATTTDTVKIYYKSGTFSGFEASPSSWTLIGSTLVTPSGALVPTAVPITFTVSIPAGGTYGFYVTTTSSNVSYTNGSNQGGVYSQKDSVQIKEGRGIAYPFGAAFGTAPASRIWNGVIDYCSPLVAGVATLNAAEGAIVYPNPGADAVTVKINPSVHLKNATANLYDLSGRLVYTLGNINENTFNLVHNLGSGMYVLRISNENKVILNQKISVE